MALDFKFEGFGEITKRVEIFDFDLGAKFFRAAQTYADIGVAAERAFLHIAIANAGVKKDLPKRGEVIVGFFGRAHVGFRNDFA